MLLSVALLFGGPMKNRIKDYFQENDDISLWIINHAIIRNDLTNSIKYLMDCFKSDIDPDPTRQLYHTRMLTVDYREAIKYISDYEYIALDFFKCVNDEQFVGLVNRYYKLIVRRKDFKESLVSREYKPRRDISIHYGNHSNINETLSELTEEEIKIVISKDDWSCTDYIFADDILNNIIFNSERLKGHMVLTLEEYVRKLSEDTMELIMILDGVIGLHLALKDQLR